MNLVNRLNWGVVHDAIQDEVVKKGMLRGKKLKDNLNANSRESNANGREYVKHTIRYDSYAISDNSRLTIDEQMLQN